MKTILAASVLIGVGLAWGFMLRENPATVSAQVQEECARENGDVDGDGLQTIGDVVRLLLCQFVPEQCPGGLIPLCAQRDLTACQAQLTACQAALTACNTQLEATAATLEICQADLDAAEDTLAICCQGECADLAAQLLNCQQAPRMAATGQTSCFDAAGASVNCNTTSCPGQDGSYEAGCSIQGRFVNNGDGTVTDTCTGLMWQRVQSPVTSLWCNAIAYCENLTLAGYDDWRLPNARELHSIVDFGRHSPALHPVFGTGSTINWTSTTTLNRRDQAWVVHLGFGDVGFGDKDSHRCSVRAVRGP